MSISVVSLELSQKSGTGGFIPSVLRGCLRSRSDFMAACAPADTKRAVLLGDRVEIVAMILASVPLAMPGGGFNEYSDHLGTQFKLFL